MALPVEVAVGDDVTAVDHNALIPHIFHVREEQTSGTAGGGITLSTWTKRALNTVALNEVTGASMASSVITLPAGVYNVEAWAVGYAVGAHKIRLRQTSGTPADLLIGSTEQSTTATLLHSTSRLRGRITLSGSTTLELQHISSATRGTNGMGLAGSFSVVELYSEAIFVKVG